MPPIKSNQNRLSASVQRKLYSADSQCSANCKYCFSKWKTAYTSLPHISEEQSFIDCDCIIYPCCDGEVLCGRDYIESIKRVSDSFRKVYVSISTKVGYSNDFLSSISELDSFLKTEKKGFVKLSLSVSNKSMIDELEPGTLSYDNRLLLAQECAAKGIFTSVTMKPILPFIPDDEYYCIVDDYLNVTDRILLGGLYVETHSFFYEHYIKNKYNTTPREVLWLPSHPSWPYVIQDDKIERIHNYALRKNAQVFDTDSDVILSFEYKG